jgi:hypothetical protein
MKKFQNIQDIMNEKVSEATGLTPNQIIYAGQINLHEGRLFPQPTQRQRQTMSHYMKEQIDIQNNLMHIAEKQQLQINADRLINNEDMEISHHTGEYIVVRHENGQAPNKLSVRWHGPYRIITVTKRPQGTVYTCYSPKDGKVADYHASIVQAHPCETDLEAVRSAVLDDNKSYIIEKILSHDIVTVNKRKVLNLTIKWHGYKEPEITGMNVSLQRNVAVQEYLKEKGSQSFGLRTKSSDSNINDNNNHQKSKRVRFSSSAPDNN